MAEYFFLSTLLPTLRIGDAPDLPFKELTYLFKQNLSKKDLEKTKVIRRFYDIHNLRALWREEPLDPHGNYDENELEEAVLTATAFPDYVLSFLEKHEATEDRLAYFSELEKDYFVTEIKRNDGFVKEYLRFEREMRLVLLGFRARKLNRDLSKELQFEDPDDDLIGQLLAQRDAEHYQPPVHYADLKTIFETYKDEPFALHQALTQYRFDRVEKLVGLKTFSIDYILAYLVQLILVEKWLELDRAKGQAIIEGIIKGAP